MTNGWAKQLVATLAGIVGSAAAVALADAAPASAAAGPSCYIVCDGQDPETAIYEDANGVIRPCNDARTIYTVDPPSTGYAELRYSRKCRMAWARGGVHGIKVEGFNADGSLRVIHDFYSTTRLGYTLAVNDAGLTARACVYTPYGGWTCTARY
jgi:hypothetical protein